MKELELAVCDGNRARLGHYMDIKLYSSLHKRDKSDSLGKYIQLQQQRSCSKLRRFGVSYTVKYKLESERKEKVA